MLGNPIQTPEAFLVEQLFSPEVFDRLQDSLEQFALALKAESWSDVALGAAVTLAAATESTELAEQRFVIVISAGFSALLSGIAVGEGYQIQLAFDALSIQQFSQELSQKLAASNPLDSLANLLERCNQIQPNRADLQSQFTLNLVSLLAMPSHCELTETALRLQLEQERLLNQVTTQIRQSLELPIILKTAVEQVRRFLQVDRLVIYQLDIPSATPIDTFRLLLDPDATIPAVQGRGPDVPKTLDLKVSDLNTGQAITQYGSVIYEARASDFIPTVMNLTDSHCFVEELRHQNWQDLEIADAVEDVETRYSKVPCLLDFLRRAQVRAKLIAPIRLQEQLWGLLIAHECLKPRGWQEGERRFLQQIAETLAIAISQAQLYAELQQRQQTLEEKVAERTQALRDTLLTAQAANRAKSEFLATVSHELRTPLACIIGMSATLQRWSKDALTERQQNFLQTIHESGEHLLSLINDILDLSQAEAGRMVLNVQKFSLSSLAQQSIKAFENQARLQEVELELEQTNSPRDSFLADPRRVRQILFNLLSNAIKFTPAGGKVTLRVLTQADCAILQVKDTGIGIPEAQIPLLFQKFQQLDTSYHREYQGTGLGLALTQQLVKLHGGSIEVESTPKVGSVFTVKLPLQPHPSAKLASKVEQPRARQRIVLVEPNEETANLICDLLLAADYQVVWVLEGLPALSQIEVLSPAVVIVNLQLPDIDGHHLIHELRHNSVTKHTKILALMPAVESADPINMHDAMGTQTASADEFLSQPLYPEILLQKLRILTN